jgi:alkylation response protein AidB-like acyl-CoA dehydrogenase
MSSLSNLRSFAGQLAEEFAAVAAQHDRDGGFPDANFARLREAGLLGLTVPRRHGGSEAGLAEAVDLVQPIAAACASTGLVLAMQLMHQNAIGRSVRWPDRLAAQVGQEAVERGALLNALRVEPELGTPSRGGLPATIARQTLDGWAIDWHKIYSTGAPALGWLLVWARTDEAIPHVGHCLVSARTPGIRIVPTWNHLGLRASASHDIVLEGVEVPSSRAVNVRPLKSWRKRDGVQTAWNVALVAAVYTGVASAARNWLRGFLRSRVPSNLAAPLATLPRMQEAMGRIEADLLVNQRLIEQIAGDADARRVLDPTQIDRLKTVLADAIDAVQLAVQLCGNHALSQVDPLERHLRDVLCVRIDTPQADSALTAAGRPALGV